MIKTVTLDVDGQDIEILSMVELSVKQIMELTGPDMDQHPHKRIEKMSELMKLALMDPSKWRVMEELSFHVFFGVIQQWLEKSKIGDGDFHGDR